MLHSSEVPVGESALLVVDAQDSFKVTPRALLLAKRIRRLAITGIQMEQCCETTARLAADLGYAVDFVVDGTMTFPIPNYDRPGEELGVEEIQTRTEYALRQRFARLTSAAQLAAELEADQGGTGSLTGPTSPAV